MKQCQWPINTGKKQIVFDAATGIDVSGIYHAVGREQGSRSKVMVDITRQ